jgi:tRNA nucleotidyltransferase (CCA-adding enzyme)
MPTKRSIDPSRLPELIGRLPGLDAVRAAAPDLPVYVVGGAVRDLLLGRARTDIDLAVEGDLRPLAEALGGELVEHERFATASVRLDSLQLDLARARAESYEQPGALPTVRPASIKEDLARRDFTVNAMAAPLRPEPALLDPHGGVGDLSAGVLRVLHPRSFVDDPTRGLRAARYAARFDFELEPETGRLLRDADLGTVSADRVEAELRKIAAEDAAPRALELIRGWGLLELPADAASLTERLRATAAQPPWASYAERRADRSSAERSLIDAILAAAGYGPASGPERKSAEALARATPERPSHAVEAVRGSSPVELLLARALGAEWLDRYFEEWSGVGLAIDGSDLLANKVPEGPAIGRGLQAALSAKLDGEISGRDEELRIALAAARGEIPGD